MLAAVKVCPKDLGLSAEGPGGPAHNARLPCTAISLCRYPVASQFYNIEVLFAWKSL